jgi:hypothetical protein
MEIFTEEDQRDIITMDCNDDFLFTASVFLCDRLDETTQTTIYIRELKSGEVVFIVFPRFLEISSPGAFFILLCNSNIFIQLHRIVDHLTLKANLSFCGGHEATFKIRFGHGLLISHTIVYQHAQNPQVRWTYPFFLHQSCTKYICLKFFIESCIPSGNTANDKCLRN